MHSINESWDSSKSGKQRDSATVDGRLKSPTLLYSLSSLRTRRNLAAHSNGVRPCRFGERCRSAYSITVAGLDSHPTAASGHFKTAGQPNLDRQLPGAPGGAREVILHIAVQVSPRARLTLEEWATTERATLEPSSGGCRGNGTLKAGVLSHCLKSSAQEHFLECFNVFEFLVEVRIPSSCDRINTAWMKKRTKHSASLAPSLAASSQESGWRMRQLC